MTTYKTVPVCFDCWNQWAPESAIPADDDRRKTNGPIPELCFGCKLGTKSGIYIRCDIDRPLSEQRRVVGVDRAVKAPKPEKPCPMHINSGNGDRYCECGPDGHEGTHIGNRSEREYLELLRAAIPEPLRAAILARGFDIDNVRDWQMDGGSWKVAIVKMPEMVHVDLVKEIVR